MQPTELEISSDPESMQSGADIIKKITRKKPNDDNLSKSLINSPDGNNHTVINVDEANELLDVDITPNHSRNGSIKMSSLSNDMSSYDDSSQSIQSYHNRTCLQNLYHSLCSCYNGDLRVMYNFK